MRDYYIEIGHFKVHCIHLGKSDKKIIFIPGWPFPADIYRFIEKYIDGYELISFDLPYWGGRTTCKGKFEGSFDEYLDFIFITTEYLLKKYDKCYLGGVSVSGLFAVLTAERFTNNLNGLFLQSPALYGKQIYDKHRPEIAFMKMGLLFPSFGQVLKKFYMLHCESINKREGSKIPQDLRNSFQIDFTNLNPSYVLKFAFDFFNNKYLTKPNKFPFPVTVIGCSRDKRVETAVLRENVNNYLLGADVIEVEGTHFYMNQYPEKFALFVEEFINTN